VTGEVRARRELEAALAVRDDFLAAASHELGTPLAIIELALHSVRRSLEGRGLLDPAVAERLERARRAGRRLARVRDSLLEVSRHRTGRLELEPEDVRLDDLVRTVVRDLADVAVRYGVTLSVRVEEPLHARLDADRVAHALTGIVDNALKFGAGRPVLVHARGENGAARIDVVDHGTGIGSCDQDRIFEPFERAVTSRSFGGLGVGLWTARRILQASGGDVLVASAPGRGATFTIRLPLA
jgi:signal transduction histidine kinase